MWETGSCDQMIDPSPGIRIVEEKLRYFFSAAQQVLGESRIMFAHIGCS